MACTNSCVLFAKPIELKTDDGRRLDIGLVGEVDRVNSELIINLCAAGTIPVIAPIGMKDMPPKENIREEY